MKLTTDQRKALDRLTELSDRYTLDRKLARRRLAEQIEKELESIARVRSQAANEALALGVSKTQIGAALGTRDWRTVNGVLELTAAEREIVAEVVKPKAPWSFDEETGELILFEWGGGPFPEATGEYKFELVWYDNSQDWNIVPGIEADNAALWTFFQKVKDEINNVTREPVVIPVAEPEIYNYPTPHAWSPEDDEKDASEW